MTKNQKHYILTDQNEKAVVGDKILVKYGNSINEYVIDNLSNDCLYLKLSERYSYFWVSLAEIIVIEILEKC